MRKIRAYHRAWRLVRGRTSRVFAVRCLGVGVLLTLEITLARKLGLANYGVFAFVLAVATVIAHISPLGWLNATTRLVRIYASNGNIALLKGSLLAAHGATLAGLAAVALVMAAIVSFSGWADGEILLKLGVPLGIGLATVELHRFILRGQHDSTLGEAMPMLLLPLGTLCAVWSLSLSGIQDVVKSYIAVCAFLVILSTIRILRALPRDIRRIRANYRLRTWNLMAGAMLVGTTSDELTTRAAVLMLGTFSTDEAAGLYQAAARLSLMTIFMLRAVTAVSAPRIAELYQAGELAKVRSIYGRSCLVSACCGAPFLLIYTLCPEFMLGMFGQEFPEAAPVLQILAMGYFVSAATGPSATGLMMIGRERVYGCLAASGAGCILVGMLVFVPRFHALGAAVVMASFIALINLCYAAVLLRATRAGPNKPRALPRAPETAAPLA